MITRLLSSATIGATVTAGLLLLMNALIELTPGITETVKRDPGSLQFVRLHPIEDPPLQQPPEPIPDPVEPPVIRAPVNESSGGETIAIPSLPPAEPRTSGRTTLTTGPDSGSLINIMKVYPTYPNRTSAHNGGFVIVQYDVNALGQVENPLVIESSHRVFNRSALEAIQKFKYRPRIVAGQAIATRGLKFKFTYEAATD